MRQIQRWTQTPYLVQHNAHVKHGSDCVKLRVAAPLAVATHSRAVNLEGFVGSPATIAQEWSELRFFTLDVVHNALNPSERLSVSKRSL